MYLLLSHVIYHTFICQINIQIHFLYYLTDYVIVYIILIKDINVMVDTSMYSKGNISLNITNNSKLD